MLTCFGIRIHSFLSFVKCLGSKACCEYNGIQCKLRSWFGIWCLFPKNTIQYHLLIHSTSIGFQKEYCSHCSTLDVYICFCLLWQTHTINLTPKLVFIFKSWWQQPSSELFSFGKSDSGDQRVTEVNYSIHLCWQSVTISVNASIDLCHPKKILNFMDILERGCVCMFSWGSSLWSFVSPECVHTFYAWGRL